MTHIDPPIDADRLERLANTNEQLVKSNNRVADASEELALATVEYQERAKTAKKRFVITIVVILLGFVALVYRQQKANDAAQDARRTLIDCVTPQGKCYQDGQARTGDVVIELKQLAILAAACAPEYVHLPLDARIAAIQRCIERRIKEPSSVKSPSPNRPHPTGSSTPSALQPPTPTPNSVPTQVVTVHPPTTTRTTTRTRTVVPSPSPPVTFVPLGPLLAPICTITSLPLVCRPVRGVQ